MGSDEKAVTPNEVFRQAVAKLEAESLFSLGNHKAALLPLVSAKTVLQEAIAALANQQAALIEQLQAERERLREREAVDRALLAWVNAQTAENVSELYRQAVPYFGLTPVIPY